MSRTRLFAVLGAVLWAALVVAAFGFLSLLLDVEVIADAAAGPLLAPAMILAAGVVLALLLIRVQTAGQGPGPNFVGASAATWIVLLLVGGVGYTLVAADPAQLLFFPLRYCLSPFIVAAALLAGAVALGVLWASAREKRGGRPRWPWEDRDAP